MMTTSTRSAIAGSRRPYRAPIRPPMVAPTAISAREPVDVRERDEDDRRGAVHDGDEDVLDGIDALQVVVQEDAEQPDHQDALRRAEVAAVDAGDEYPGGQRRAAAGLPLARRAAVQAFSLGCMITSTQATRMSTGTISVNALAGSDSSRIAPASDPAAAGTPSLSRRPRCPASSRR